MANYYTQLSVEVALPSEKAAQDAVALFADIDKHLEGQFDADTDEEAPWPEELAVFKQYEYSSDLIVEVEGSGIWVHDENGGPNVNLLADYLKLVLQKLDPQGSVGFEWAVTCDKHRPDGFGGGAIFVTAQSIDWITGWEWLTEKRKQHREETQKAAGDVELGCSA